MKYTSLDVGLGYPIIGDMLFGPMNEYLYVLTQRKVSVCVSRNFLQNCDIIMFGYDADVIVFLLTVYLVIN